MSSENFKVVSNFPKVKDYVSRLFESEGGGYIQLIVMDRKLGKTYHKEWVGSLDEFEEVYAKCELLLQLSEDARIYMTYNLSRVSRANVFDTIRDYLNILESDKSETFGRKLLDKLSSNMVKSAERRACMYDLDTNGIDQEDFDRIFEGKDELNYLLHVPTPKGWHYLVVRTGKEEPLRTSEYCTNKGYTSLLLLAWNEKV